MFYKFLIYTIFKNKIMLTKELFDKILKINYCNIIKLMK